MALFNDWKLLTDARKGFIILDIVMVFLRYISVKQILNSVKNWSKLIYFFLLQYNFHFKNLTLNNKYLIANTNCFNKWFTMHYNYVEKLLSAHRFGHSIFYQEENNQLSGHVYLFCCKCWHFKKVENQIFLHNFFIKIFGTGTLLKMCHQLWPHTRFFLRKSLYIIG